MFIRLLVLSLYGRLCIQKPIQKPNATNFSSVTAVVVKTAPTALPEEPLCVGKDCVSTAVKIIPIGDKPIKIPADPKLEPTGPVSDNFSSVVVKTAPTALPEEPRCVGKDCISTAVKIIPIGDKPIEIPADPKLEPTDPVSDNQRRLRKLPIPHPTAPTIGEENANMLQIAVDTLPSQPTPTLATNSGFAVARGNLRSMPSPTLQLNVDGPQLISQPPETTNSITPHDDVSSFTFSPIQPVPGDPQEPIVNNDEFSSPEVTVERNADGEPTNVPSIPNDNTNTGSNSNSDGVGPNLNIPEILETSPRAPALNVENNGHTPGNTNPRVSSSSDESIVNSENTEKDENGATIPGGPGGTRTKSAQSAGSTGFAMYIAMFAAVGITLMGVTVIMYDKIIEMKTTAQIEY